MKTHFISPLMPVPDAVAEWLFGGLAKRAPCGVFDFSDTLAIVPTRRAGRALSEKQAALFEQKISAAYAGLKILTGEDAISRALVDANLPGVFERSAAWMEALESADEETSAALFPHAPPAEDAICEYSRRLARLKGELAQCGKDFSDVARVCKNSDGAARWEALARVEKSYRTALGKMGRRDFSEEAFSGAPSRAPFTGVKKIFLLCHPSPAPILCALLSELEKGADLDVLVCAEECERENFDAYGRPLSAWASRKGLLRSDSIFSFADREEQSAFVAKKISAYAESAPSACAVACEGDESSFIIEKSLAGEGVKSYNPSGRAHSQGEVFALLGLLKAHIEDESVLNYSALLRHPRFLSALSARTGISSEEILKICDGFFGTRVCVKFAAAARLAKADPSQGKASEIFSASAALLRGLESVEGSAALQALDEFFGEVLKGNFESEEAAFYFSKAADALRGALEECAECRAGRLDVQQILKTVLGDFDARAYFPPPDLRERVCLQNWMELFWSSAPRLYACDMNEGLVPENFPPDGFLSESLRAALGLPNSAERRARDAYMAHTLSRTRSGAGMGALFLCARRSAKGDVLSPSGLLLSCPPDELPARVNALFSKDAQKRAAPSAFAPWRLKIPNLPLPESLSATDFKAYISCPFRFYLKKVLKMKTALPPAGEMDSAAVGTLFHAAFEDFAKDENNAALADASKVEAELLHSLDARARRLFGENPGAQLRLQLRGLRQRLSACAQKQAERAGEGWRIYSAEKVRSTFSLCGFQIRARIDRVDVNEDGRVMVIDYKTFDSAARVATESSHLKRAADGSLKWIDLQMPIYLNALRLGEFPDSKITCGYFLAPANAADTRVDEWDMDAGAFESAMARAEEIASLIRERNFSPAEKPPDFDEFAELFSFDALNLERHLDFLK